MKHEIVKKHKTFKAILIFAAVMAVCYGAGFIFGKLLRRFTDAGIDFTSFKDAIYPAIAGMIPIIYLFIFIFTGVLCFSYIKRAKGIFTMWNGEDEDVIDRAEYLLNKCMLASNITLILGLFLFTAWIYFERFAPESSKVYLIVSVIFILMLILEVIIQRSAVELEKKINPEKRGELLDFKFRREWEASFDEAQMMMQYKAAYASFKLLSPICMLLWILCVIGEMAFGMGLSPVLFITVLWLTLMIVYHVKEIKLEKKGANRI